MICIQQSGAGVDDHFEIFGLELDIARWLGMAALKWRAPGTAVEAVDSGWRQGGAECNPFTPIQIEIAQLLFDLGWQGFLSGKGL